MIVDERTLIAFCVVAFALGVFLGNVMGQERGFRKGYWSGMQSILGVRRYDNAAVGKYDHISH